LVEDYLPAAFSVLPDRCPPRPPIRLCEDVVKQKKGLELTFGSRNRCTANRAVLDSYIVRGGSKTADDTHARQHQLPKGLVSHCFKSFQTCSIRTPAYAPRGIEARAADKATTIHHRAACDVHHPKKGLGRGAAWTSAATAPACALHHGSPESTDLPKSRLRRWRAMLIRKRRVLGTVEATDQQPSELPQSALVSLTSSSRAWRCAKMP
jgi:hypothetical protein